MFLDLSKIEKSRIKRFLGCFGPLKNRKMSNKTLFRVFLDLSKIEKSRCVRFVGRFSTVQNSKKRRFGSGSIRFQFRPVPVHGGSGSKFTGLHRFGSVRGHPVLSQNGCQNRLKINELSEAVLEACWDDLGYQH